VANNSFHYFSVMIVMTLQYRVTLKSIHNIHITLPLGLGSIKDQILSDDPFLMTDILGCTFLG